MIIALKKIFCFTVFASALSCFVLICNISIAKEKSDPVAVVNGEPITRTELADFLIDSFSKEGMEILIRRVLVEQEATKNKLVISQEEIDIRVNQMIDIEVNKLKSRYGPDKKDEFEKELEKMGYDEAGLRKKLSERILLDVKPQLMAEKLIVNTIKVSEEELKAVYAEKYGEKVQVRQIVVKTKEEADEVLRKYNAGADFAKLANESSLDRPSAAKGGLMQPFSTYTQLGKSLASLKKGDVTDVVPSKSGFHIFKVEGLIKPSEVKSYEDALPELNQIAVAINLKKRSGPWFLKLLESAEIKNYLDKK